MKKKLRLIAVDLTPVLPGGENGGAKIFVLELLRFLADMHPKTQFVLLTQSGSHEELATMDRVNMRRKMVIGAPFKTEILEHSLLKQVKKRGIRYFSARLNGFINRFWRPFSPKSNCIDSVSLLKGLGVDLLFCPFTAPTYYESDIPIVCTIYDLQYKTYPQFFSVKDVAHRDYTFIQAARRATKIAAISEYSRSSAIFHGNLDPSQVQTIHLRMAQRVVPSIENNSNILGGLGLTSQRYIIYPANFWKHKNHEMLLIAFSLACSEGLSDDIQLVCTGASCARQTWLKQAVRIMNLSERVIFPGYLSDADIATLMIYCSGIIFPSLYEGFGLPVIEAMAVGVPVACSNLTSLPEVADNAAILFDPRVPTQISKAIISLVEDQSLRLKLVKAGQQRVEEFFDSQRMATEYWDLFNNAVANIKYENSITGVHGDGWIGRNCKIVVAPSSCAQKLNIELRVPEWTPHKSVTVNSKKFSSLVIDRGHDGLLSLSIEASGETIEIQFDPIYVPAHFGMGEDLRELSLRMQKCVVIDVNGREDVLFLGKVK